MKKHLIQLTKQNEQQILVLVNWSLRSFRNNCTDLGDVCNIEKSQNMKLDTVWNFSLREEKPYQSAKLWALKQQFMHCQVTLSSHKMEIRIVFVLFTTYFHENPIFIDKKTKATNVKIRNSVLAKKMVKRSNIFLWLRVDRIINYRNVQIRD